MDEISNLNQTMLFYVEKFEKAQENVPLAPMSNNSTDILADNMYKRYVSLREKIDHNREEDNSKFKDVQRKIEMLSTERVQNFLKDIFSDNFISNY
jgi:type IV secretory pathway component VirB8